MKLKLKITRHTTASELVHLGNFFTALGLNSGAHVFAPPPDAAELDEPDTAHIDFTKSVGGTPDTDDTHSSAPQPDAPKRRRRTKAEIEAEAHASQGAPLPGPFYWSHPESDARGSVNTREELDALLKSDECAHEIDREQYEKLEAAAKREVGNDQPAPTQTAPETTNGAVEAPATEAPSERPVPTHATLNLKATAIAKKIGPEKIKNKINELGGKLISTLSPEALIEFDAWLDAQ